MVQESTRRRRGIRSPRGSRPIDGKLRHLGSGGYNRLVSINITKAFGLTAEKAFQALCARTFDASKEDIDNYANDIFNDVDTAFERCTAASKDAL